MDPLPDTFLLSPTGEQVRRRCPSCGTDQRFEVMKAEPAAPVAMRLETFLRCGSCGRMAIPAGIVKRGLGLALLLPFAAVLAAGFATSVYLVASMVRDGNLEAGFLIVALVLAGATIGGFVPLLRTLKSLVHPHGLLRLAREPSRHRFESEL